MVLYYDEKRNASPLSCVTAHARNELLCHAKMLNCYFVFLHDCWAEGGTDTAIMPWCPLLTSD